jgi:hypothetical protein
VKDRWVGRWAGRTVACIASGPSLTSEDCEAVRSLPSIVTNTTFRMAPWATVLLAHDLSWWREYAAEVAETFPGERVCVTRGAARYGAQSLYGQMWFKPVTNSGACAISLAVAAQAVTVLLIGYDCQKTDGQTHWHGDHPPSLTNALTMATWPAKFSKIAQHAKKQGTRVVNCSRQTALDCFERGSLAEFLHP